MEALPDQPLKYSDCCGTKNIEKELDMSIAN